MEVERNRAGTLSHRYGMHDCPRCGHIDLRNICDHDTKLSIILTELNTLLEVSNIQGSPCHPPTQPTDYMTSIPGEIDRLNDLISKLQSRRALLLQRMNHQSSPICALPSELLAEIFQYADAIDRPTGCSVSKRRHPLTPFRLGAVCSHWRQVAWSSPQLWSHIPLTGCWAWQNSFPVATVLKTYFENMKAMSLEMAVGCFRGGPFDISDVGAGVILHEDAFRTIFVENADKLKKLGFRMWPRPWLPHIDKVQQTVTFSNLEEVTIKSVFDIFDGTFSIINAPRLRTVELAGVSTLATIRLPWSQITRLVLSHMSSDLCLTLFIRCMNLEYFRCHDLNSSSVPSSGAVKEPITFRHLKTFHFMDKGASEAWREAVGQYFSFPTLESVIWQPSWGANVGWQLLCLFPDSIQSLKFQLRRRDKGPLKSALCALVSLSSLRISCWPSLKHSLLELLTPQLGAMFLMLPSLRELHLSARTNQMTRFAVETLLEMIRLRRTITKGTLDRLVLSYNDYSGINPWPRNFVQGIREFVRDGMKVVIEVEGESVDYEWLQGDFPASPNLAL